MLGPNNDIQMPDTPVEALSAGEHLDVNHTAAARSLPPVNVTLDGSLDLLASPGVSLLFRIANFTAQRTLMWSYAASREVFITTAAVAGNVTVQGSWPASTGSSSSSSNTPPSVACQLLGVLSMTSITYPGPGMTSNYVWSGNITLSPDPWAALGLVSPAGSPDPPAKRLLLSVGSGVLGQPAGAPSFGVTSSSTGKHATTVDACSAPHLTQPPHVHAEHHSSRQLQQSSDSPTPSTVTTASMQVSGTVRVLEHDADAPGVGDEAARGDGQVWLDALGTIRMTGKVPEGLVPAWKRNPKEVGGVTKNTYQTLVERFGGVAWRFWALIGGGVLFVLLLVVGLCCCWQRRKQRHRAMQEQGIVSAVSGPDMFTRPVWSQGETKQSRSSPSCPQSGHPKDIRSALVLGEEGRGMAFSNHALGDDNGRAAWRAPGQYKEASLASQPTTSTSTIAPWWEGVQARTTSPSGQRPPPSGHERRGRNGRQLAAGERNSTPKHSPRRTAWD